MKSSSRSTAPAARCGSYDFWPKTEMYSQVQGTITVANELQKNQNFSFAVAVATSPLYAAMPTATIAANNRFTKTISVDLPCSCSLAAVRSIADMASSSSFAQVPLLSWKAIAKSLCWWNCASNWRADLLHVHMQAVTQRSNGFGSVESLALGTTEMWTATHLLGDHEAAAVARRYMDTEQNVRQMASHSSQAIHDRSLPTVFHKVGAALDVVQPKIPANYLQDILFNLNVQYFNDATSKLPVDLRVAALDYWDERSKLMKLANR